ncbi:hypothetical protein OUZ56_010719 [Daphnia magna]|uniref:Uncharacterized protein n=1 Tax=Daphnia magna TaxID=35525 RepID=A0ABQ9YYE3_9CRUS|nr:hypothetical protein OUZ56_010719 [Daphnia magna]
MKVIGRTDEPMSSEAMAIHFQHGSANDNETVTPRQTEKREGRRKISKMADLLLVSTLKSSAFGRDKELRLHIPFSSGASLRFLFMFSYSSEPLPGPVNAVFIHVFNQVKEDISVVNVTRHVTLNDAAPQTSVFLLCHVYENRTLCGLMDKAPAS